MRVVTLAAVVVCVLGAVACGSGTFYAANRPTPGGQGGNAQGGRRGLGFGVGTVGEELASRGVTCSKPSGPHHGSVLYATRCD